MTGRRKLGGPLWERHSRGLAAASGSSSRARSSLLAMCTTWGKWGAWNTHLCTEAPPATRHSQWLPCRHLHADVTRLVGGPRGECDLDPRMS